METKTYRAPVAFKAGEAGEVEAVFATLNVVDFDGDVTLPGAFGEQAVFIEAWNHNLNVPPVGKGVIQERENEAVLSGAYFLDTQAGREHYAVAKNLAAAQEWSYTFHVVEAEPGVVDGKDVRMLKRLEVVGVGQVTRGAGVNTRTVAVKGRDFSPDEVRRLKALLLNEDFAKAAESGGGDSDAEETEGEGGDASGDAGGPVKPSGVSPSVLLAQLEITAMEE